MPPVESHEEQQRSLCGLTSGDLSACLPVNFISFPLICCLMWPSTHHPRAGEMPVGACSSLRLGACWPWGSGVVLVTAAHCEDWANTFSCFVFF